MLNIEDVTDKNSSSSSLERQGLSHDIHFSRFCLLLGISGPCRGLAGQFLCSALLEPRTAHLPNFIEIDGTVYSRSG